jgi:hypothetical protein
MAPIEKTMTSLVLDPLAKDIETQDTDSHMYDELRQDSLSLDEDNTYNLAKSIINVPEVSSRERLSLPDGGYYVGGIADNLPHGEGMMVYGDGSVEKGIYDTGILTEGTHLSFNGLTYEGKFDKDGGLIEGYAGRYKIGKNAERIPNGIGFRIESGKPPKIGKFENGKLIQEYKGEIKDNVLRSACDNPRYGKNGELILHGQGFRISEDGKSIEEGVFEDGNLMRGYSGPFITDENGKTVPHRPIQNVEKNVEYNNSEEGTVSIRVDITKSE